MPKQKFPEAEERLFHRVFVCMKCGAKIRSDLLKVRGGKAKCRRCKTKQLRQKHKDQKA
ncbi:MAG: 50S ribosomal protein L40e [Candidatus Aenigmatarchaeota archaeon]|nr:MAG: 50S ribosomal protein L40e [Candidatus Aenigmarchaeota archaeon]